MWGSSGAQDHPQRSLDPLLSLFVNTAHHRPTVELLVTAERAYSYGDFLAHTSGIVTLLREHGVQAGHRVALYADAYDSFFIAMLGVWLAGGVAVPINTALPAVSSRSLIERSQPRLLLHDPYIAPPVTDTPAAVITTAAPRTSPPEFTPVSGGDVAMILFTSGTTGMPKGVCQRLSAITGNARRVAAALKLRTDDRLFINTPAYYTSGICHFLTMMAAGASTVGETGFFFGEALLDRLLAQRCTGFGGAPAHLIRVVDPLLTPVRTPGLRFWVSSGDHLPMNTLAKTHTHLPDVALFNMYGLTEVSGRLCVLSPEQSDRRPGSVGRPLPDMRVVARNSTGEALHPGQVGELYVQGPLVMTEYLDDAAATAAALGSHGFRTGDYGHVDADGFVWVEGRKDDVFKRGGEKVSTVQIQQAMGTLDDILDCAVLAIEDPFLGHTPIAFIVPREGYAPRSGKLLRALREHLPASSLPSRIIPVISIPRTGSGKVIRQELLALLEGPRD
jgi:acyl-CoA synthetase (AMP-forming)/AMP-acid ligase II